MKKALNLTANLLLLLLGAESIGILIAGTFSVSVPSRTACRRSAANCSWSIYS